MSQARENSNVVSTLSEWADRAATAAARSRVRGLGTTLRRWTRGSYLVQWLTAEPDPDVIVIDLRDTYTIGPVIAGLDVVTEAVAETRTARAASKHATALSETVAERPVRAFSVVALVALLTNVVVSLALGGLDGAGAGVRLLLAGPLLFGLRSTRTAEDLRESWLWKLLEPPEPPEEE